MSKFSDLTPSTEKAIVSKVLLALHRSVDENFPEIANHQKQFKKTVFSGDGEKTRTDNQPNNQPITIAQNPGNAEFAKEYAQVTAANATPSRKSFIFLSIALVLGLLLLLFLYLT